MNKKNIMPKAVKELRSKMIDLTIEYDNKITYENLISLFMFMSAEVFSKEYSKLKTQEDKDLELENFVSLFSYTVRGSIKSFSEAWEKEKNND